MSELTHDQQVAELTRDQATFYKDMVRQANDNSITARALVKRIRTELLEKNLPRDMLPAARLASSRLLAMYSHEHAATYNQTAIQLAQVKFEDNKKALTQEMYRHQANQDTDSAAAIQKTLNGLVSPQQRHEDATADAASIRAKALEENKDKADADFAKERKMGIESLLMGQRMDRNAAGVLWDTEHGPAARTFVNRNHNVLN